MAILVIEHHHYLHFDIAQFDGVNAQLNQILKQGAKIMSTMQEVLADLDDIKAKGVAYIAGRDAVDVQLRADLAAALAAAGISPSEQADIDLAFTKAEEAKALLTPPVTPAP